MIQITAQIRLLVAIQPVDGRKGIDSLARVCQEKLSEDPISGCVFIFRSRRGASIRLLSNDGQGCWFAQKRLSEGRFARWPESSSAATAARRLDTYEAQLSMVAPDLAARLFHTSWQWLRLRYRGTEIHQEGILSIRTLIERYPNENRSKLSTRHCEAWRRVSATLSQQNRFRHSV